MVVTAQRSPSRLGPFTVTGQLGEGGGGVVYAAERDGEPLALKVPRLGEPVSERDQERRLEEARLLALVDHPSIVRVHGSGVLDDGRPYVAMERLDGRTLAERIAAEGPMPLAEALRLFEQLADATAALHDAGLLHRDLKAENVFLVDDDRSVKLLDFGIAKDVSGSSLTTTGVVRGTPATMAPERFLGAPATHASDVYELAIVLYVMLVGRLPWPDEVDVRRRLTPLAPLEAGAPIPVGLSQEILRALSLVPEQRPASARELAEGVRATARGRPSSPPSRTVTSEHLRPWVDSPTPLDAALSSAPNETLESMAPIEAMKASLRRPGGWRRYAVTALVGVLLGGTAFAAAGARNAAPAGRLSAALGPMTPELRAAMAKHSAALLRRGGPAPTLDAVPTAAPIARSAARRPALPASAAPSAAAAAPPAAAAVTSIPGGVYEIAPYK